MRCHLIAVGRGGSGPEAMLVADYAARLTPRMAVIEVEERKPLAEAERSRRESVLLLAAVPRGAVIVALDPAGHAVTSEAFAARLGQWRDQGAADLAFLIGGAAGHTAALREQARFLWSLGPATLPHLLARAVAAEQIYRGFTILAGHPYHRGG